MATVNTCDRCRRELTHQTRWIKLKPAVAFSEGSSMAKEPDIDLCGRCWDLTMAGFKNFADSVKAVPDAGEVL
jgi:hypothetical protein